MIVRIVSYTENGAVTAARVAEALREAGHDCRCFAQRRFALPQTEPLTQTAAEWAAEGFRTADALVFCCAAGIAVRAIAPLVKDKKTDPAVIVLDEQGRFVIPLLSGHLGGANELAQIIAEGTGAVPVITTATDLNGVFAVDVFAKKNDLRIENMTLAKDVSAALLAGEKVGFRSDLPWEGTLPDGLTKGEAELGVCVGPPRKNTPFARTLFLVPRRYAAGIGCKKGKSGEALEEFLLKQLSLCGISIEELRCVASIDLKRNEAGLTSLCRKYGLPFLTYPAEQLAAAPGNFTGSDFVLETTGVDSVCERAAVLAGGGGDLIQRKTTENGMTFALAECREVIRFE